MPDFIDLLPQILVFLAVIILMAAVISLFLYFVWGLPGSQKTRNKDDRLMLQTAFSFQALLRKADLDSLTSHREGEKK